jgi:hypothetical protein
VGKAIATILPDHQEKAVANYIEKLKAELPSTITITEMRHAGPHYTVSAKHHGSRPETST